METEVIQTMSVVDGAIWIWLGLTVLSLAYVAIDAARNNPELAVMKWGWLLVTLYSGPVGAALYVLSCQEPAAGSHERFVAPLWKQALGSTIHCMAGDATGIILAAAVTAILGLPMGIDAAIEYFFGFAVGLLIFQAFFMRDMTGGSYRIALRRSAVPEWLSMNAVMGGMIPVMILLMTRDMRAMDPLRPRFWAIMSLATLVGGVLAYPVNAWLVAVGLKHGMGTVRVLGQGGTSVPAHAMPAATDMPGVAGMARDAAGTRGRAELGQMSMATPVTRSQIAAMAVLTLLMLGAGSLVAAASGRAGMRPGMHGAMPPMSAVTPAAAD